MDREEAKRQIFRIVNEAVAGAARECRAAGASIVALGDVHVHITIADLPGAEKRSMLNPPTREG